MSPISGFKGRSFVPVVMSYDPATDTIIYEMLDQVGMAKVISNYAKDELQLAFFTVLARRISMASRASSMLS